ncbi:hypothetical protein [Reyranella sp. CPCC 100927]|uniref:hypothetical protein n=1 Tax=Reyranella sp. CPCC 100927 TaxID=2599616 RepID=UPI0011B3C0B6|nr:hypothetical protein [Reyranella sp. CPCC 100927]TWS94437.1 hypothetical protein FQU96_41040 [Reyranella sp. CPCC 100927]
MHLVSQSLLAAALLMAVATAIPVLAQPRQPAALPQADRPTSPAPSPPRTGKERLGGKWTDEQRLDNCKVPPDKRGTKPRPATCPGALAM